ncbi:hypothetical protein [Actinophytocola sp. KF-1]
MRVDIPDMTPSTPATALAHHPDDVLVSTVLDARQDWWRRRTCALALSGRIAAAHVPALLDVVRDSRVTTEVRAALLDVLPPSDDLLTWLRTTTDDAYNLDLAILRTRARLGDRSVARDLVRLRESEWHRRRTTAELGIDLLGERAVLDELGFDSALSLMLFGPTPAARALGVRWSDPDITQALADESRAVAREAYDRLANVPDHHGELRRMVTDRAPGHLWALAVLAARGEPIADRWEALGRPRVEVPGLPEDVREAIVREYVPGTRETDPLWLLEAACLPAAVPEDVLPRAMAALAPVNPERPVPAGDHHRQGEGTYHVIETDAGRVTVSTLGPFYWSEGGPDLPGFRRIDDTLGGIVVTGLPVYFFGSREPLTVHDLLFYWQD